MRIDFQKAIRAFNAMRYLKAVGPRKIDFYILSEILGPFAGGLLFFIFVFLMFQVLRLAEFFIIHGVSGPLLGKLTGLMILSFLPTALPVAFLLSILIAFGRLSADSELIAMKACGMGIWRLSCPPLFVSLIVMGLSLLLNLELVPWGDRLFKRTLIKVSNTKVASSIQEGTFNSDFFDLLIFADKYDSKTNRLKHVFLFDEREKKTPLAVIAEEGELLSVKSSNAYGVAALLKLYHGNIHRNDLASKTYQKIDFGEYRLFLKIDEGADTAIVKPKMIPTPQLLHSIKTDSKKSQRYREHLTELIRRFSVALSPMLFVFLGVGFGTIRTRTVRTSAALVAFIVILLYWALQTFGVVAAHEEYLHPFVALSIPNLVLLVLAWIGFRTALW